MEKKEKEKGEKRKVVGYSNFGRGTVIHNCYLSSSQKGRFVFACKPSNHILASCGDKFTKVKPVGKKMCVRCSKIK